MENFSNENELSAKRHLFWGAVAGLAFGSLSLSSLFFDAPGYPITRVYMQALITPAVLIMKVVDPIYELEGMQQVFYVLVSPVFWALAGLGFGYVIYRFRYAIFVRSDAVAISPSEKLWNRLRIFAAVFFTLLFVVASVLMYRNVVNIKKETKERIQSLALEEDAKRQKKLEEELQKMQTELEEKKASEEIKDIEKLTPEKRAEILASLKWERYTNAALGASFDYPAGWEVQKKDFYNEEFELWIIEPGENDDPLAPDPLEVTILGTKEDYMPDHAPDVTGGCAYEYISMEEFCQEGCEKLNANTAIDFRYLYRGEPLYSAAGFSTVSSKFPRLCIEMMLDQLFFILASPQDRSVADLVQKYDLRSSETNSKISPDVFRAVSIFRHMADSLSAVK